MTAISFDGRVAIVTGAGREHGLGRACALELASRGAAVVVDDPAEDGAAAERVAAEIRDAGGRAVASAASIATEAGGEELTALALEAFGAVDVVVHNAGSWRNAPFGSMTAAHVDPVLDVHLRGGFFVTRPAWQVMTERGYGRIVLMSSPAGFFGRLEGANYTAAKTGLYGLCRSLALEGAPHGVQVNCVVPIARTMSDEERAGSGRVLEPSLAAASEALRGRDEPERVAALVAWLASDACPATGEAYTAIAGQYGRVLVALTEGWLSPSDRVATAEEIAARWEEIESDDRHARPGSVVEAMQWVAQRADGVRPDEVFLRRPRRHAPERGT